MSYREKYLKYKQKFFTLKNSKIQQNGGNVLQIVHNDGQKESFPLSKEVMDKIPLLQIGEQLEFGNAAYITKQSSDTYQVTINNTPLTQLFNFKVSNLSSDEYNKRTVLIPIYKDQSDTTVYLNQFYISPSDVQIMAKLKPLEKTDITVSKKDKTTEVITTEVINVQKAQATQNGLSSYIIKSAPSLFFPKLLDETKDMYYFYS